MDIEYWNAKIYRDDNGKPLGGGMHDQEFFDEFGIKSYPLFKDKCYYHIPEKWANDVRAFIKQAQSELAGRFEFSQIKEKWCQLTVYYSADDEAVQKRMNELISECADRLRKKGLHP